MTTPAAASFRLPEPKQCVFWEHPERMAVGRPFECVETLVDDRHLTRSLLRRRECGQL